MPREHAGPRTDSSSVSRIVTFCRQTLAVAEADVRKLRHDPVELLTRMIQPMLWLLIFGEVFAQSRAIPTGDIGYLEFIAPGILAQSVLFIAIFYGVSVIWERDLGILHKFLVSPISRSGLVLGRALSSGVRGLSQALVIYALALLLGVHMRLGADALILVILTVMLGSAIFSTFSLIAACLVKTRERFMGIGQVLTMPLFFASNAIYPMSMMPSWLQSIAKVNPLTYQVDALRALMILGASSAFGLGVDYAVQLVALAVLTFVATKLYPTIIN
jgi:ABC-2 type transport system permease protein